jgi:iron complex transport system permease protein
MKAIAMNSIQNYQRLSRKRIVFLWGIGAFLLLAGITDMLIGSSSLTLIDTLRVLFEGPSARGKYNAIVWGIRLPMTLTCFCVGASLGLAGEQMQTILNNPLASPYTLGVSAAAGFGAALSVIYGFPFLPAKWLNVPLSALIFALIASVVIAYSSSRRSGGDTKTMILFGIVITFFFSALQSLMQYMATQSQAAEILHWLFGSLSKATWSGVAVCSVIFVVVLGLSIRFSWSLTALSAGEDRAKSLGINTALLRVQVFIMSALLTATAVSYVGSIGFVGLVAPHFARIYVGEDQRYLAPASAIFGMAMLLVSSIISKRIKSGVIIPVGIITNLVGVCFLAYQVMRRKTL